MEDDGDGDYVSETETELVQARRKADVLGQAGDSGKGPAVPVECPTCHKKFLSKYYLKVHNR